MKFGHARCEVCNGYLFREADLIAYRRRGGGVIEPIDLKGEQPWSGIGCVCLTCVRTLASQDVLRPIHPGSDPS
jgi:hypothetical protein